MKIAILTIGTRGDVQPYLALAKGIQAEGHDVVIGAPDEKLFPLVSAVVHHSGAGSTAAGLRVEQLGCGPRAQPLNRLRPEGLAGALRDLVSNEPYRTSAQGVAASIAREDGVRRAIEVITTQRPY